MTGSSYNPQNICFTCNLNFNYPGIMTLNGLLNGYQSPPSSNYCNPPIAMSVLHGPTTTNANIYQASGGMVYQSGGKAGNTFYGFNGAFSYNLPDGSLLNVSFTVSYKTSGYYLSDCKYNISTGSLFQIVDDSITGYTLTMTVQMQQ